MKKLTPTFSNKPTKKIALFFLLLVSLITKPFYGQTHNSSSTFSNGQLVGANTNPLSHFTTYNFNSNSVVKNAKTLIKLNKIEGVAPFDFSETTLKLEVTTLGVNQVVVGAPIPVTLKVSYNPMGNSTNFNDQSIYEVLNAYGARVKVVSYQTKNLGTGTTTTTIPANIDLTIEARMDVWERLDFWKVPDINAYLETAPHNGTPVALHLSWNAFDPKLGGYLGVKYAEIEWTWVDGYDATSLNVLKPASEIPFTEKDFQLNSTRIRLNVDNSKSFSYKIPVIYPKGYLIYRLRFVGEHPNNRNKEFYGQWSSYIEGAEKITVEDWTDSYVILNDSHEKDSKNWQKKLSFAEEGKHKEVVSYSDGSNKIRQTVTKTNTENQTIVGEVIYDHEGRQAIEVLPTPIKANHIGYFKDVTVTEDNSKHYSYLNFDLKTANENSCTAAPKGMGTANGASRYYSNQNDIFGPFTERIPDAKKFPFSQTEYTPDNTGKITRKGGVGLNYQLGSGHETQYFYTLPYQEQLNRIFGYSVGFNKYYDKNIVVDPNGQVSVSYIDPKGKTIATALAGGNPDALKGLEDEENNDLHKKIKVDLLGKANAEDTDTEVDLNTAQSSGVNNWNDQLNHTRTLGVAGTNVEHNFEYRIKTKEHSFSPDNCPTNYPFVYDLEISLKDECGADKLTSIKQTIGTEAIGSSTPINTSIGLLPNPLSLNTGSYPLQKKLSVNYTALNNYAKNYIEKLTNPASACYIPPSNFKPELNVDCETSCEECTKSIGTPAEFVLKNLKGILNIPKENNSILSINSDLVVTILISDPNDETINLGQKIIQNDVNKHIAQLKAEWIDLNKFCEYLCGEDLLSACESQYEMLKADVSPHGQYGNVSEDFASDATSLYNTSNNMWAAGSRDNKNWKNPKHPLLGNNDNNHYFDDNGAIVKIPIFQDENGFVPPIEAGKEQFIDGEYYVEPQYLQNIEDFLTHHKSSWDESLVTYHPEYCYYQYSEQVCALTKPLSIQVYGGVGGNTLIKTVTKTVNSDQFNEYLNKLDTFDKAQQAGLFNLTNTSQTTLMLIDPYFSAMLSKYDTQEFFTIRYNAMKRVLETQYKNVTNSNGTNANLFQATAQMLFCNAITQCNYNNSSLASLTTEQKNQFWNKYKLMYQSFKKEIQDVFLKAHAVKEGCINYCIGNEYINPTGATVSFKIPDNILPTLFKQLVVSNMTQNYPSNSGGSVLCQNGIDLTKKTKRYNTDDSTKPDSDNPVKDMINESDYQIFVQTGKCPLMFDTELFLNDFFTNYNNATGTSLHNAQHTIGQGFTRDLFTALTNTQNLPVPTASIKTDIAAAKLLFNFTPQSNTNTTIPFEIEIVESQFSWNDYKSNNSNGWSIANISQFYYDKNNSTTSGTNLSYAFKALVRVVKTTNPSQYYDFVIKGRTKAAVGECYIKGIDSPTAGDALETGNKIECESKIKFANALKNLLNNLREQNLINRNSRLQQEIDITNNTVFKNGYLYQYLDITPDNQVTIKYSNPYDDNSRDFFTLNVSGSTLKSFSFSRDTNANNLFTTNNIDKIIINENDRRIGNDMIFYISNQAFNGKMYNRYGVRPEMPLYFGCCDECGEFDKNLNGLGDLCEETKITLLKKFYQDVFNNLNNLQQNTTYNVSSLSEVGNKVFDFGGMESDKTFVYSKRFIDNGVMRNDYHFQFYGENYLSISFEPSPYFSFETSPLSEIVSVEEVIPDSQTLASYGDGLYYYHKLKCKLRNGNSIIATIIKKFQYKFKTDLPPPPCEKDCIPQLVGPISCVSKYPEYVKGLESKNIAFQNTIPLMTQEDFCNFNVQYLVDSYLYYLTKLNITSIEDQNYMGIMQFGHTNLNYGYNRIKEVIDLYAAYNPNPATNPTKHLWNNYVDKIYVPTIMKDCPPPAIPVKSTGYPPEEDPCEAMLNNIVNTYQNEIREDYFEQLRKKFIENYLSKALSSVVENFDMTFYDKEYHYTLYYYDQSGNLIQTVAPEGVKRMAPTADASINNYRALNPAAEDSNLLPAHDYKTEYKYNSLNQLVWQKTPDGGASRFAYDDLGRIIASQNDKQANPGIQVGRERFSYTLFDQLGRVVEVGETSVAVSENYDITNDGKLTKAGVVQNQPPAGNKSQVTKTVYTEDFKVENTVTASSLFTLPWSKINNRNRITAVMHYGGNYNEDTQGFDHAYLYNYDLHGNVKEMVQYFGSLKDANCDTALGNDCEAKIKRVTYSYDLISGNVNQVVYQPNKKDQFMHRYYYDADNRITNVQTSNDGVIWETDATYQYYLHGPLAKTLIGDKRVQGLDYAYTLQGWLKVVNGENLQNPQGLFGQSGSNTVEASDVFGYSLQYNNNDYQAIVADAGDTNFKPLQFSRNGNIQATTTNLYNGNITTMTTALRGLNEEVLTTQKNQYDYDQLNRLMAMKSSAITTTKEGNSGFMPSYSSSYSYDRNGNLKTLNRTVFNKQNVLVPMDKFEYKYTPLTNKLTLVKDNETANHFTEDLKDQVKGLADIGITFYPANASTHNYVYDAIGNLIEDKTEGLKIDWRVDGKVKTITNSKAKLTIDFIYDGMGYRSEKRVTDKQNKVTSTYYVRDPQGNVMATYELVTKDNLNPNDNKDLNNLQISNSQNHQVAGTINVTNSKVLAPNGNLDLKAVNEINFYPNFDAIEGSILNATIEPLVSQGSVLSLNDHHIYGSSRLGVQEANQNTQLLEGNQAKYVNIVGDKRYELANHLGNVLEVINDKRLTKQEFFTRASDDFENYADGVAPPDWYSNVATPIQKVKLDPATGNKYLISETGAQYAGTNKNYTTVPGKNYRLRLNYLAGNETALALAIKENSANIALKTAIAPGYHELVFTATTTQVRFAIGKQSPTGAATYWNIDNVVLEEISPNNQIVADVVSFSDYFPFGMAVPNRNGMVEEYRYGYQGSEKDNELKGNGNSYTTEFRQLDPRIGRWLSIDPKTNLTPWDSPYVSMANSPIMLNDPNGDFIPLILGFAGMATGVIYGLASGKSGKEIAALAVGGFVAGATLGVGTLAVGALGGVAAIGAANSAYIIGGASILGGGLGNITEQVIKNDGNVDGNEVIVNMAFGIPDAILGGAGDGLTKNLTKKVTEETVKKVNKKALKEMKNSMTKSLRENGLTNRQANKVANKAIDKYTKAVKKGFEAQKIMINVNDKATSITLGSISIDTGNKAEDFVKPKEGEKN